MHGGERGAPEDVGTWKLWWRCGMAAGAQAELPEEARAISSAKQDAHRAVVSGAPRKQVLLFLGTESKRQLSLLLSPSATEQSKSPQALLITHCCLEFPSPCCLDTELLAFPCDPKQEFPKNSSWPPSRLCAAGPTPVTGHPGTWESPSTSCSDKDRAVLGLQIPLFSSFQLHSDSPRGPALSDLGCPHLLLKLADHTGELQNRHSSWPFLRHMGFQAPPGAPGIFNYFSPFFEALFVRAACGVSGGTESSSPHRLLAVCSLRLAHPSHVPRRDAQEHGGKCRLAVPQLHVLGWRAEDALWKSPRA